MGEYILREYLNKSNSTAIEKYKWVIYSNIMDEEIWRSFNEAINNFEYEVQRYGAETINLDTIRNITIEYHGNMIPIHNVCIVSMPEYNKYRIYPFDDSIKESVFKRIQEYLSHDPTVQNIQTDDRGIEITVNKKTKEDIKKRQKTLYNEYSNIIKNIHRKYSEELKELRRAITGEEYKAYTQTLNSRRDLYKEIINKINKDITNSLRA